MNDYIESRLDLKPSSETLTDLLAAALAEAGYESFVPDETGLTAYVRREAFDAAAFDAACAPILEMLGAEAETAHNVVEGRDWNAEWEKNYFRPILIDGRVAIHSTFHTDVPEADYDIVIDPKMAFGTGHHATTTLMMRRLLSTPLAGLHVMDMGTGTGILAILASMLGAAQVDAVEIDPFAHENAVANAALNGVTLSSVVLGDASALAAVKNVDVFLANINRNIIVADLAAYVATLSDGASMFLSGFYEEDVPVIVEAARPLGLSQADVTVMDRWASLHLVYHKNPLTE